MAVPVGGAAHGLRMSAVDNECNTAREEGDPEAALRLTMEKEQRAENAAQQPRAHVERRTWHEFKNFVLAFRGGHEPCPTGGRILHEQRK